MPAGGKPEFSKPIKSIITLETRHSGEAVADEPVSINSTHTLTAEQFAGLADVPPELVWLANITRAC